MRGLAFVVVCVSGCVIRTTAPPPTTTMTASGGVVVTGSQPAAVGSTTSSANPESVAMLALGESYTCSLSVAGQIKCGGTNIHGALGVGSKERYASGVVTGIDGQVRAIAAGGFQNCALTTTGDVWCWGFNNEGQVGSGATTPPDQAVLKPTRVAGLTRVRSLHLGDKISCALTEASELYCWGQNGHREIVDSSTKQITTPTRVSDRVELVGVGNYHICYVTDGRARCTGELSKLNAEVGALSGITGITGGHQHSCAIHDGGKVSCWGADYLGVLGHGNQCANVKNDGGECVSRKRPPSLVPGIDANPVEIGGNTYHSCVRFASGGVTCFGNNQAHALWDSRPAEPWQTAHPLEGVVADRVYVGGAHVCTVRAGVATCRGNAVTR